MLSRLDLHTRRARRILAALLCLALFLFNSAAAHAQQGGDDPKNPKPAQFGAYTEKTLDLQVSVPHGSIQVYRVWEGDKKRWRFNPQHDDLALSDEKSGEEIYGQLVSEELHRGLRAMDHLGNGVYGQVQSRHSSGGSGSGGGGSGNNESYKLGTTTVAKIQEYGVKFCTNSGLDTSELAVVNQDGVKWASKVGRQWGQYTPYGIMQSWGIGSRQIGQVLRAPDNSAVRGYSDSTGAEVITYIRDAAGRIEKVRDYTGREVSYTYNAQGQLDTVIDIDGNPTRYVYNAKGDIINKIAGSSAGVPPDDAESEQVTYTLTYNSSGQVTSELDQDGNGESYTYEFDPRKNIFTKKERLSNGLTVDTVSHVENGIKSIDMDGEPYFRVYMLCEDSVIEDRHNRETYFDRDEIGRLQRIIFPDGSSAAFEHTLRDWPKIGDKWDVPGKAWGVKRFTNANGISVDYLRNTDGQITEATENLPGGGIRKWKFEYNPGGYLIKQRLLADPQNENDSEDWIDNWSYNGKGLVETHTDALGNSWSFQYDARGDLTQVIGPNTAQWNFTYNKDGNITYRKTPNGFESFWEYNRRGLLKRYREVYAAGQEGVTRFYYNAQGLVKRMIDPSGGEWYFQYDGAGNLMLLRDPAGKLKQWTYKRDGRVKSFTDGNAVTIHIDYYDTAPEGQSAQYSQSFGPVVKVTYPTYVEEQHFDLRDNLVARKIVPTNPAPGVTTRITTYQYDAAGRLTKTVAPDGKETVITYDELDRVTSVTRAGWGTSSVSYSADHRTVTRTDALGNAVVQTFNRLGQLISERRADNTVATLSYDAAGNLQSYLNSKGELHWFSHDLEGNLTKHEIFPGGTHTGSPAKTIDYDYNLRGDLVSYSDGAATTTITRDALGRPLTSTQNFGPFSKSHSFTYLANGQRGTYTGPDGVTAQYIWDDAGQLLAITVPGEGDITYTYDAQNWGKPTSLNFPGGSRQEFSYDALRRLTRVVSKDPASNPLLDYQYSFLDGSVISQKQTEHGTYDYEYDAAYRLTSVNNPSGSDESYTYDVLGNRRSASNPGAWSYNQNGAVTAADGVTFEYDNQGNRVRRVSGGGTVEFVYDAEDRLIRIESPAGSPVASYGYDAMGFRVWKEIGGQRTYFYYTDEGLAAEFDSSGNLIRSYLYEPESYFGTAPLALRNGSGAGSAYYYFHTDHLGTPQKLVARNGSTAWLARYSGYGAATVDIEGVTNPLRFPGQYYDAESGLHQNLMRMYDPAVGAYLEQDPYGVLTGPNRYAYAYGNPAVLSDPTGEIVPAAVLGIGLCFLAGETLSGFPIADCAEALWDGCLFSSKMLSCLETGVNAVLSFGSGCARLGLKLLRPGELIYGIGRASRNFYDDLLRRMGRFADELGALPGRLRGKVDDAFGRFSRYEDIRKKGTKYANFGTDVGRETFETNLRNSGWSEKTLGKGITEFEKDGSRYVVRDGARSTGGPAADYYPKGSEKIGTKIRLGGIF